MECVIRWWIFLGVFGQSVSVWNEDEWEPVYRIYSGENWNSRDDYLSQERTARDGDEDDSQFRSWKLDQWNHHNIQKVRMEIYDDGDLVVNFEFKAIQRNSTNFFSAMSLKSSNYVDLFGTKGGAVFAGDDFSFDGDGNYRHWSVSGRHTSNCRTDEGWFQIIDKPTPGRDLCICGYENVGKYPAIMYSKLTRKTKWSDARNVGYADMMQISVSFRPFPTPAPTPVTPSPMEHYRLQQQYLLQQQQLQQQQQQQPISQTNMWLEFRKRK